MIETTYSDARANLRSYFDRAVNDRETILVRRRGGGDVAIIAADELASLEATAYLLRSLRLVEEVRRDPFRGIGKPELLKQLGSDIWSRRLTDEHRLVYRVGDERIDVLQARYRY